MLGDERRQLGLVGQPEANDRRHADSTEWSSRGGRGATEPISARTRASSDATTSCGVPVPDQLTGHHDADLIAQRHRLRHVVRHEDHALGETRLDAAELLLQLPAGDRIESAERFVHQQHRRVGGERAGDADALTLTAGQFVGPPGRVGVRREADQIEQFAHARGNAVVRPRLQPRHDRDVVGDVQMRKEADLLNHVADRAAEADGIPFAGVDALHQNVARIRQEQAIDQLEDRGLAGAAARRPAPASRPPPTVSDRPSRIFPRCGGP